MTLSIFYPTSAGSKIDHAGYCAIYGCVDAISDRGATRIKVAHIFSQCSADKIRAIECFRSREHSINIAPHHSIVFVEGTFPNRHSATFAKEF